MTIGKRIFEETIKDRIAQLTRGKIKSLQVELGTNQVVIHGCVPTYYLKQMALQGVRNALGAATTVHIEHNIEVSSKP